MRARETDGEELLSIGQMARLNAVSEKALRVYQAKGILEPQYTDAQTGYRYYTLSQCAALDMVQQLQVLGYTLEEIAATLREGSVESLRQTLRAHVQDIERREHELRMAHQVGADLLRSCEAYLDKPPFGELMLETLPERHLLEFELDPDVAEAGRSGADAMRNWELNLRAIRRTIVQSGWPISLFRNVGCSIALEDLRAGRIAYNRAFVFVTPAFGEELYARARAVPAATYLVTYADGVMTEDGRERETVELGRLLRYCDEKGLEPAGDYLGEIIADGPAFLFEGREMIYRMCLPVRLRGQSDWIMPGQRAVMTAWREG